MRPIYLGAMEVAHGRVTKFIELAALMSEVPPIESGRSESGILLRPRESRGPRHGGDAIVEIGKKILKAPFHGRIVIGKILFGFHTHIGRIKIRNAVEAHLAVRSSSSQGWRMLSKELTMRSWRSERRRAPKPKRSPESWLPEIMNTGVFT